MIAPPKATIVFVTFLWKLIVESIFHVSLALPFEVNLSHR